MPTVITPALETVINTGSQDLFTISTVTTIAGINPANVVIANSAGGFTTNSFASYNVGDTITISGSQGGTGSITAYTSPTTYYITATNQTSQRVRKSTQTRSATQTGIN